MNPRIGEPRIYVGEPEVIYPGEHASAAGGSEPKVWTVEPSPGFGAAALRLCYRMFGQWVDRFLERWRSA